MFDELLRRIALDVTGLANLIRTLAVHPFTSGRLVTGTLVAGKTSVSLTHGLGRDYRGAVIVVASAAAALTAALPTASAAKTITFTATSAPGADITFKAWVF